MTVALIAESGIRFMDLPVLLDEIRISVPQRITWRYVTATGTNLEAPPLNTYRRFVKMDDHTYVEKD